MLKREWERRNFKSLKRREKVFCFYSSSVVISQSLLQTNVHNFLGFPPGVKSEEKLGLFFFRVERCCLRGRVKRWTTIFLNFPRNWFLVAVTSYASLELYELLKILCIKIYWSFAREEIYRILKIHRFF